MINFSNLSVISTTGLLVGWQPKKLGCIQGSNSVDLVQVQLDYLGGWQPKSLGCIQGSNSVDLAIDLESFLFT